MSNGSKLEVGSAPAQSELQLEIDLEARQQEVAAQAHPAPRSAGHRHAGRQQRLGAFQEVESERLGLCRLLLDKSTGYGGRIQDCVDHF